MDLEKRDAAVNARLRRTRSPEMPGPMEAPPQLSPKYAPHELDLELEPSPALYLRKRKARQSGYRALVHEFGVFGALVGGLWVVLCLAGLITFEREEVRSWQEIHQLMHTVEAPAAVLKRNTPGLVVHSGVLRAAPERLVDTAVGIAVPNTLFLRRRVEMFQYLAPSLYQFTDVSGDVQTVPGEGYTTGWSDSRIHTDEAEYRNPETWSVESLDLAPAEVFVGDFALSADLRRHLEDTLDAKLPMGPAEIRDGTVHGGDWELAEGAEAAPRWTGSAAFDVSFGLHEDGRIYTGDPSAPKVGDLRIRYSYAPLYSSIATALGGLRTEPSAGKESPIKGRIEAFEVPQQKQARHGRARSMRASQDFSLASPMAEALDLESGLPFGLGQGIGFYLPGAHDHRSADGVSAIGMGYLSPENLLRSYMRDQSSSRRAFFVRILFGVGLCIGLMFSGTPLLAGVAYPLPSGAQPNLQKNVMWAASALLSAIAICLLSGLMHVLEDTAYALGVVGLAFVLVILLKMGIVLIWI